MYWPWILWSLLLITASLLTAWTVPEPPPAGGAPLQLPDRAGEWRWDGQEQQYDDRTIFKYIDGGAEIYRSYGLKRCLSRRYEAAGQPAIVLDRFELASAKDAFGVFTHDLDGAPAGIGQDSRYRAGWLCFWQNRFYASIYAEGDGAGVADAINQLGRTAAGALGPAGPLPELLAVLPEDGLERPRRRYLHDHVLLNLHYFLAGDNLLGLSRQTEAVLGEYLRGGAKARLLVVRYPDATAAGSALATFLAAYLPEGQEGVAVPIENGMWSAARRQGPYLAVVLEADRPEPAADLLQELESRMARLPEGGKP